MRTLNMLDQNTLDGVLYIMKALMKAQMQDNKAPKNHHAGKETALCILSVIALSILIIDTLGLLTLDYKESSKQQSPSRCP